MQAQLDAGTTPRHLPPSSYILLCTIRARWRQSRARSVTTEEAGDAESRAYEDHEAENLLIESEKFLARQMEDMQALTEEQRMAGILSKTVHPSNLTYRSRLPQSKPRPRPRILRLPYLDKQRKRKLSRNERCHHSISVLQRAKEWFQTIKESAPPDKESLFKTKVRWDGLNDSMIDHKFELLVKRLMVIYLGELEDDDLIMFVLEHLKDHKSPQKLLDSLEPVPVLEDDAQEFALCVWRQVTFESMVYDDGLLTERMIVD